MSKREPRRPKWVEGPAKVSSVKSVAYDPTNEAVTSFLQGALVQEPLNPFAEESEQKIALNMKLLSKKSATTKTKALENISNAVDSASDEVAGLYIYNFLDLLSRHIHHESPQVRCGFYKTLEAFVSVTRDSTSENAAASSSSRVKTPGNSVKRQIAQNLGSLMSCWLSSLHDPDTQVALAAERSFLACFPAIEKRQVALERSFDSVSKHIMSQLEDGFRKPSSKQVKNEEIDTRASYIIMAFGAVSYMLKYHPSPNEVQPLAIGLLSSRSGDYLRQCLPTDPTDLTRFTNASPKVRPSAIKLLSDIVGVKCPITKRDYSLVWNTISSGIVDPQPAVSCAAWRLALLWFENFKEESSESLPDSFIGLVLTKIDNLSSSSQGPAVEAFLSALLPVAAVVSRIPQHCDIVDDVCGALTEAVKHFSTRPNSPEYALIWKTLFECWELHLLRKFANGKESHSTELLAVILAVLVEQVATAAAHRGTSSRITVPLDHHRRLVQGLERAVVPAAEKHLGKGLARILRGTSIDSEGKPRGNAEYVKDVMFTLIDKGEKFKVLAYSGEHKPILIIFALNIACLWVKDPSFDIVTASTIEWLETLILDAFEECKKELAGGIDQNGGLVLSAFSTFIVQLIEEGDREKGTQSPLAKAYQLSDDLITQMTTQLILWDQFSDRLAPALFKKKVPSERDSENESSVSPSQIILASFLAKPDEGAVVHEVSVLTTAVKSDILHGDALLLILDKVITASAMLGGRFSELTPEVFKSLARQKYKIPILKCNNILSAIVESIEYIRCSAYDACSGDMTHRTPKSLIYDNEAPSSDSSDSESSENDRNEDSSRSDNDDIRDDVEASQSGNRANAGILAGEITAALFEWMDIIGDPTFYMDFITCTDPIEKEMRLVPILREILYGIASMSPLLCWESFCSLPLLRNSISCTEDTVRGCANLLRASQRRCHRESVDKFYSLIDSFEMLCRTDIELTNGVTDKLVNEFMHMFILSPVGENLDSPLCATSSLPRLFGHLCESMSSIILIRNDDSIHPFDGLLTEICKMPIEIRSQNGVLRKGRIPLIEMSHNADSLSAAVRFGQLIQVLTTDKTNLKQVTDTKSLIKRTPEEQKEYQRLTSLLIGSLIRTVAFSAALNDNIVMTSEDILGTLIRDLPKDLSSEIERQYCREIWEMVAIDLTTVGLLESLGAAFSRMESKKYSRPMTYLSQWFVTTHFASPVHGALPTDIIRKHTAFQLFLSVRCGEIGSAESCTFISKECETTIRVCLMNPKLSAFETITLLAILRTDKRLVVTDDEMMVAFNKVTKGVDSEIGLELLAELCCAKNGNANIYADICRATAHWASLNYSLKHFPSNGKLGQRIPTSAPIPITSMRPPVLSLIKVSRGLSMRERQDVLRSTINLAVFDATCDCIHRLGPGAPVSTSTITAQRRDISSVVDFIAEMYPYLSSLQTSDITSIAASEKSVTVISNSLYYVHLWLCGSTLIGLETIGLSNILEVLSCINTIAMVALGGNGDSDMLFANCHGNVQSVAKRCLIKSLRELPPLKGVGENKQKHKRIAVETTQKVKINFFRKNFSAISRTTKQKLSLFTYISSWVCIVSNSINRSSNRGIGEGNRGLYHPKAAALGLEDKYFSDINKCDEDAMQRATLMASHEVKGEIYKLMDLIVILSMCPTHVLLNGALSTHTENDDNGDNSKNEWKTKYSNRLDEIYLLLTQENAQYAVGQGYVPSIAFDPQCLGRLQQAARMSGCASKQSVMLMDSLARGAISLYALLLQSKFLSYVKDWLDTVDISVSQKLVSFTETHISPVLIQEALAEVLSHNDGSGDHQGMSANSFDVDEDFSVTVSTRFKGLILTYVKDEAKVSCNIVLPPAYPLHAAQIPDQVIEGQSVGKRSGGAPASIGEPLKWQTWMMKMTAALFSTGEMATGSLWNAVKVFGNNVKRHYEGAEPCPICYSIVSMNNKLPDMDCRVCKNRCHSSCLYQWWANSGQTSCPFCRSAWVS